MPYDHQAIERKWQAFWEEQRLYEVQADPSKPKYYVLDMFPYPSGAGLHVGHVVGYTATDIIARYKRMRGYNVLHPMGWDSFGLPAEQYAIRTGIHPRTTTATNIDTYRRQLKSMGFSYDWSREIATSDSSYYKWTQWIFTQLYQKGLAYEAEIAVNYCPALGTVLANEEVDNGKAKEGGYPVIRKPLRQWVLRITEYADRLLADLETLEWPQHVKALQANWIGKSIGANVHFTIRGHAERISIFTTCQDTLFGATFLVLAPEHPFVDRITLPTHREAVDRYHDMVRSRSDIERTELNREKTGVFTGAYAINPATGAEIPIWVADYVLPTYGTGAVMGVPAHDQRDIEFARKHQLPIVQVVEGPEPIEEALEGGGIICNSGFLNGLDSETARARMVEWLVANGHGEARTCYKLRDWLFSRQRYWGEPIPILHFADGSMRALDVDELPLCPPELTEFAPTGDGQSPLTRVPSWVDVHDAKTNQPARRETNTMPQWAGSCWYYLRFCDPRNEREAWDSAIEQYWMPVDLYVGGIEHATLHLLYARFWHKVLHDLGHVSTSEPFPRLRNQGLVVARSYQTAAHLYVPPEMVEEREGRYYHKETGEELTSQIDKMSKSKLNGISPDEVVTTYGADALRLYEMFMGPLEKEKVWSTASVSGCRRFLQRVYDLVHSDRVSDQQLEEADKLTHRLVAGVTRDMEALGFNTVISQMMEWINAFTSLERYPRQSLVMLVQLLAPLAPHLAEECWQRLGQQGSVSQAPYPVADGRYLQDEVAMYVVQVNGKVRARVELPRELGQEAVVARVVQEPNVQRCLDGQTVKSTVFVPHKIVNFVVTSCAGKESA